MCVCVCFFFFFFSSRRRHTRFDCDWSSDVCSSDLEQALDGGIEFGKMPKAPATLTEVVAVYEQSSKAFVDRIRKTPDTELNKTVKFFVAPKQMGDVRKMDLLWFMLMDQVHHRGQFSIYLRMADGKVPSIYGPSADEPWM